MSLYGKIIWHLQSEYNTPIVGFWSKPVVSPDGNIIGHLQPKYNTPIESVWSILVVSPDRNIIGHLIPNTALQLKVFRTLW